MVGQRLDDHIWRVLWNVAATVAVAGHSAGGGRYEERHFHVIDWLRYFAALKDLRRRGRGD